MKIFAINTTKAYLTVSLQIFDFSPKFCTRFFKILSSYFTAVFNASYLDSIFEFFKYLTSDFATSLARFWFSLSKIAKYSSIEDIK